jgi:hypothetical protein
MINRLSLVAALVAALGAPMQGEVDEYQVKAAFLYNFAKFVEWPPQTFKEVSDPFVICVLGENPFGRQLGDVIDGKTVDGRVLKIRPVANAQQAGNCQILFISSSERNRLRSVLGDLKSSPILTVGDTEGFAAAGGVINFTLDRDAVRIEINAAAAKQKNLQISSKLLSLAHMVR